VAGVADFDPKAKARSAELREEMKRASQAIAKDPALMRRPSAMASPPRSGTSSARPNGNTGARRAGGRKR
jgi:hypothetical protein